MRLFACLTAMCLGLVTLGAANAQQIGKVATITPQMQGQPPGGSLRTLGQGSSVVADQRIVTGRNGRGQLLFLDETTLSIASRSEVVLDRFVYDPNRRSGEIGLSLTRGALRFIGGRSSDRQPAEIRTPTGTVSIRGSTAMVLIQNGRTIAVFVSGKRMCFQVAGGKQHCTNRRGGVLDETGYRGKMGSQDMARLLARIDGRPGRSSGNGAGSGSGIVAANPPESGAVSSQGGSYDERGSDSTFRSRLSDGILPNGLFGGGAVDTSGDSADSIDPEVDETDGDLTDGLTSDDLEEIVNSDSDTSGDLIDLEVDTDSSAFLCRDAEFVADSFGGDISACFAELGV